MNRTVLAASLALGLTVFGLGNAASAEASSANATLVPGPVTRLSTTGEGHQEQIASSALKDGGYMVLWRSPSTTPSQYQYYLQRFDDAGHKVGGEARLSLALTDASVAVLAEGSIVAVYVGSRDAQGALTYSPSVESGVFIQKFNSSGAQVLRETAVVSTRGATEYGPGTIVALDDGGFTVSWNSNSEPATFEKSIFSVQRYDGQGNRNGSPIALSVLGANHVIASYEVQAAPGGAFLLKKTTNDPFGENGCVGIKSQSTATSAVRYDQYLVPRQVLAPAHCAEMLPLKDGNLMVFQARNGSPSEGGGLLPYSQLYDANGALLGPQKPIAARSPRFTAQARYTRFDDRQVLADGSYLLAWVAGPEEENHKAQRYTSKGDPIGEAVSLGVVPSYRNKMLSLAGGSVVLTGGTTAYSPDIYMQRLSNYEAAVCIKPAAWVIGQQYAAGAHVSYSDGLSYVAKFANPGYNPTISTYFWAPVACSVAPPSPACAKPAAWVIGQQYAAGARVSYSDGLSYVAKFANPGYNPTISTYFWAPVAC